MNKKLKIGRGIWGNCIVAFMGLVMIGAMAFMCLALIDTRTEEEKEADKEAAKRAEFLQGDFVEESIEVIDYLYGHQSKYGFQIDVIKITHLKSTGFIVVEYNSTNGSALKLYYDSQNDKEISSTTYQNRVGSIVSSNSFFGEPQRELTYTFEGESITILIEEAMKN